MNPLTESAVGIVSLAGIYFQVRWSRRGVAMGPTLLTTLGIFFCFMGIAIGLAHFDPNDVKSSIPNLLQGIRTSFWVSVTGIGWALTIKIRYALLGDPGIGAAPGGTAGGATVDDLAGQLLLLNAAVAGPGEASLAHLLAAGRNDNNQRLELLTHALDTHAQEAAQANAEVLVAVLSEVVRDFNSNLTVQFGENFSRLNEGVERLVTWQVQYERQMNTLIERESAMVESMTEVAGRHRQVVNDSAVFVGTAESLKVLLETLNGERDRLAAGLTVLAGLIEKAAVGLPNIEGSIVEMTRQIARGVQTNQEMLGSVLKSSWQSIQVHNQHLSAIMTKSLEAANRDAAALVRQAGEAPAAQQVA